MILDALDKVVVRKVAELVSRSKDDTTAPRCLAEIANLLFAKLNREQRAEFLGHLMVCGPGNKPSTLYKWFYKWFYNLLGRGNA